MQWPNQEPSGCVLWTTVLCTAYSKQYGAKFRDTTFRFFAYNTKTHRYNSVIFASYKLRVLRMRRQSYFNDAV